MFAPVASIFVTKMSLSALLFGKAAPRVGKLVDEVVPATYTLPLLSIAMLLPESSPLPPR